MGFARPPLPPKPAEIVNDVIEIVGRVLVFRDRRGGMRISDHEFEQRRALVPRQMFAGYIFGVDARRRRTLFPVPDIAVEEQQSGDILRVIGGIEIREADSAAETRDRDPPPARGRHNEANGRIDIDLKQCVRPALQFREIALRGCHRDKMCTVIECPKIDATCGEGHPE